MLATNPPPKPSVYDWEIDVTSVNLTIRQKSALTALPTEPSNPNKKEDEVMKYEENKDVLDTEVPEERPRPKSDQLMPNTARFVMKGVGVIKRRYLLLAPQAPQKCRTAVSLTARVFGSQLLLKQ